MMTGCNAPKKVSKPTHQETVSIDVNGAYTTKHDVALYLHTYHKLPKNFITKREAIKLGWQGGGLDGIKDGYCIGGDRYGNYEKHTINYTQDTSKGLIVQVLCRYNGRKW